jgi:Zn-dependent protease
MEPMDLLTADQLVMLPLWYAAFLLAVTCHEAAHAWVAWLGGDPTAYAGGQVTLNPLPHIQREPVGTVLVPLVSYVLVGWTMGWASAPYDPYWEDRHPRRAALMALAGPLANLALAALAFAVLKAGIAAGWWFQPNEHVARVVTTEAAPGWAAGLAAFTSICLLINCVLFLFNLFPVPPLDGGSVVAGLGKWGAAYRDMLRSSFSFMGLIVAWVLFGKIFGPLYALVAMLL